MPNRYSKHFATYQEWLVHDFKATKAYLMRADIDNESRAENENHIRYVAGLIIANAQPARNYNQYNTRKVG